MILVKEKPMAENIYDNIRLRLIPPLTAFTSLSCFALRLKPRKTGNPEKYGWIAALRSQ
jgi:hypothetical protein